ncbi:DNA polymerase I [Denitrobaculum tricleocarpae]|uniref:DNA polymerase I n=1 Tax=Denitrobaculum tricleocarpae TaxID=2591009 RepID=A0A545TG32_9PROT|nr:DNA polymerase I [Denitrobaculum tricleocarpae]TQV76179.1 DNA polymerase I [Denitrobaculum tricleocarpae]
MSNSIPFNHIYLIDGSGYIFRAFYGIPPMTRPDGTPVNAVYGYTNMLIKLLADHESDGFAVIFDAGRESFRNEFYPQYKAQRPDAPEELIPQFGLIREATRAFNLPSIEMKGYEADDLIATYAREAKEAGVKVTIVSSDKDLMQLVEPDVELLDPMKNIAIGEEQVLDKFGVKPDRVVDVQALAGDSVDNVPGVPGIGIKTAAQLINEYGDLESLLNRAEEIKQPKRRQNLIEHAELARISRRLVELKRDVPVDDDLSGFDRMDPDGSVLRAFLEENGFRSIIARLGETLGGGNEAGQSAEAEAAPGESEYELVQTKDALARWIAEANKEGIVTIDTETTGLDAHSAELVGVSLSCKAGKACYIPVGHRSTEAAAAADSDQGGLDLAGPTDGSDDTPSQIPRDEAIALLKPVLEDAGVLKVGQNIKYDMIVLARYGIEMAPIDDTMLLSYVIEGGLHGHGMDDLAQLHFGHSTIKFKDVAGSGKSQVTFDKVPLDKALDYAAEDADITGRLHRLLKPRLVTDRMTTVYETIERPLVPVLARMERTGIKVDRDVLRRMSNDFAQRLAELETQIHTLAGRSFTIGSPKQLGEILFDEMSLPGGKKGKSGAYATGADILESLAAQGHDLPARVLDWRQLAKLKSTYTDSLQEQINPETGRIHTSYAQAIASTGRLSSNDPNLQNIPIRTEEGRKIREAFVAEEGCKLLSVDYSQIELRLAAEIADIESLRQAFLEGQDIHAITASQVFGVPVEGMDPMIRRQAKAINFGIIYGISAFGLANNLRIPQNEARNYIAAYFERYPGIKAYMERAKADCKKHGFVTTLFGRKIHIPAIGEKNPARKNFGERAAINAPIQGTAADVIKRAMIRVPRALATAGLDAKMLLQVHDELLFEVPEAQIEETTAVVREVMEKACDPALKLSVPLVADAGVGRNWAEAH